MEVDDTYPVLEGFQYPHDFTWNDPAIHIVYYVCAWFIVDNGFQRLTCARFHADAEYANAELGRLGPINY
jgi:hypothetical protein